MDSAEEKSAGSATSTNDAPPSEAGPSDAISASGQNIQAPASAAITTGTIHLKSTIFNSKRYPKECHTRSEQINEAATAQDIKFLQCWMSAILV